MHSSLSWQRILSGLLFALLLLPDFAHAAVPNRDATPAYSQEQTIMQTEKDTPEPGWFSPESGRPHFDRHYIVPFGILPEQDVILQRGGNTWRTLRNWPIATASGILLLVMPLLIFVFYRLVGPLRLEHPESGRKIERFSDWERTVHWATAISFVLLALTGLILMFGKKIILPWLGHTPYSWVDAICIFIHNFVGPLFILCSIIMFATFAHRNIFRRWDWLWIKSLITRRPAPPTGFFNAGEKLWFWGGVTLLGLVMSVTGLVMDFANLGQTRYILQWANYLHIAGATFFICAAMGHIYIGTIGMNGAFESMRHGTVDEEWAREHHELWYNEVRAGGTAPATPPPRGAAPRPGI